MALVAMRDMLQHAYRNGYAIGGFDLVSLDFLEAIITAAERQQAPIILSLAESHFEYYDFELTMAATVAAARRTAVPVAIHLDHGSSLASASRAINLGCTGVMVDASSYPLTENIARTRAVVEMAHSCGVPVEGELGYVAGVEGEDAEKHPGELVYTAPDEAAEYVARTQVDCLAVSIGTVHGRLRGEPQLDLQRLAELNSKLGIPLVIHGGTGLSDTQFRALIERGVAKINYYTALADAAAAQMRANVAADAGAGYTGLMRGVQAAIAQEVERCIRLWGSAGQAGAVIQTARPWREVEHVILYKLQADQQQRVAELMARGQRELSPIPGVRRVFTGNAVKPDAAYQHCWVVRFASSEVIASYRDHPAHRRFADQAFRPFAGDRVSVDYVAVEPDKEA